MAGVCGRIFRLIGVGIAGVCRMNRWRSQKMFDGWEPKKTVVIGNGIEEDPVSPSHYQGFSNGAEVIDITENLNFCRGNAIKYLARAGAKDPTKEIEDLRKAAWYVQREIERLTGASSDQ